MTDKLRQAAQQALECIERLNLHGWILADFEEEVCAAITALKNALEQQAEPVSMRMPKVGDRVICLEDESLGEVVSLTGGGSPDITFDDGTRGTYLLREFVELFGYAEQRPALPAVINMENFVGSGKPVVFNDLTTPPQRPWVGLTDEEATKIWESTDDKDSWELLKRVEAKLKERNT